MRGLLFSAVVAAMLPAEGVWASTPDEPIAVSVRRPGEWVEAPGFELAPSRNRAELFQADVHWINDSYLQPPATQTGRRIVYSYGLVDVATSTTSGRWEAAGSLSATVNFADSAQLSALSLNVPEGYFGRQVGDFERGTMKVFFGRKLEDWSRADAIWHLGLAEPRFRWDPLRPERNGLTGFFVESNWRLGPANVNDRTLSLVAMVSPLYLPETGPSYSIEDGKFVSASPFFTPPPSQIDFNNKTVNVRYGLELPPLNQILLQPSFGLIGRATLGATWIKASWLNKPLNSPLVAYDGGFRLDTDRVQVSLQPHFARHNQFGLDAGYDRGPVRPWVSALWDSPTQPEVGDLWTMQQAPAGGLVAGGADVKLPRRWMLISEATARLSYLSTFEGAASDRGRLAVSNGSLFESRYPYRSAMMLELRLPRLFGPRARLSSSQRLIREFTVGGVFWSGDVTWRPLPRLSANLGIDLLASRLNRTTDGGAADFLGTYRGDDRVRAGVSYAF